MKIIDAERELGKLRDHIATKPPSVAGDKMSEAIQTIVRETKRIRIAAPPPPPDERVAEWVARWEHLPDQVPLAPVLGRLARPEDLTFGMIRKAALAAKGKEPKE